MNLQIADEGIYSIAQLTSSVPTSVVDQEVPNAPYTVGTNHGMARITASGSNAINHISVYSAIGQRVLSQSFNASQRVRISYTDLAEGVYVIRVNKKFTEKVFLR